MLLGPRLGNSPVPSIVQCLARKDGTDDFYQLKVSKLQSSLAWALATEALAAACGGGWTSALSEAAAGTSPRGAALPGIGLVSRLAPRRGLCGCCAVLSWSPLLRCAWNGGGSGGGKITWDICKKPELLFCVTQARAVHSAQALVQTGLWQVCKHQSSYISV